ncbi:glycoside hydrolase family 20 zincin-like fold domain-containing protein [Mycoplasma sp. 5912]
MKKVKLKALFFGASTVATACVAAATSNQSEQTASHQEYAIFPMVHNILYQNKTSLVSYDVNLVYENGIDSATKNRIQEALAFRHITSSESRSVVSGKTNILVGIQGDSDNLVDNDIKKIDSSDDFAASNFAKNDAYVIKTQDNYISLLAKDSDAAFFGATTLWHIFQQLDGYKIEDFTIKDYADVKIRGFMDSHRVFDGAEHNQTKDEMIDIMRFSSYYKINTYIFEPDKTLAGAYANNQNQITTKEGDSDTDKQTQKAWMVPLNQAQLDELTELAKVSKETHVKFVFALDALLDFTNENYDANLTLLKAKYLQAIKAGVRKIGLMSMGEQSPKTVQLFTDLVAWIKSLKSTYPDLDTNIIFEGYFGRSSAITPRLQKSATTKTPGFISYYASLPSEVQPLILDDEFNDHQYINEYDVDKYTQDGQQIKPIFFKEYPDDFARDANKLYLRTAEELLRPNAQNGYNGEYTSVNVDPSKFTGFILSTGNKKAEFSKFGFFDLANITWKILPAGDGRQIEKDLIYQASFRAIANNTAIETPESIALRRLGAYIAQDTYSEALFAGDGLTPAASNFYNVLNNDNSNGTSTYHKNEAQTYLTQLNYMFPQIQILKENKSHSKFIDTISEFILAASDYFQAQKYFVLTYIEANKSNPDDEEIVDYYIKAQNYFLSYQSRNYYSTSFRDIGIGSHFTRNLTSLLTPQLLAKVEKLLPTAADPQNNGMSIITDLTSPNTQQNIPGSIFTLNNQRQFVYTLDANRTNNNRILPNNYFGVKFDKPIDVKDLQIKFGTNNSNSEEYFIKFKIQYHLDTDNKDVWNDLPKDANAQSSSQGSDSTTTTDNSYTLSTSTFSASNTFKISVNQKNVRAIRMIDTETGSGRNKWFRIYEFVVNTDTAPRVGTTALALQNDDQTLGSDSANKLNFTSDNVTNINKSIFDNSVSINNFTNNKFIQFKLANAANVSSVVIDQGKNDSSVSYLNNGVIEYWDANAKVSGSESTTGAWVKFGNLVPSQRYQIIRGKAFAQFFRLRSTDTSFSGPLSLVSIHLFGPGNQYLYTDKNSSDTTNLFTQVVDKDEFGLFVGKTTGSDGASSTTSVNLTTDKYVGLDLKQMYQLNTIKLNGQDSIPNNVSLETSRNGIEWYPYTGTFNDNNKFARYIRIKKATTTTGENNQEPTLSSLDVKVVDSKTYGRMIGSNVQTINGWGEDTRYSGNAIDGNVSTYDIYNGYPFQNDYIIYDLGNTVTLNSLKMYVDKDTYNYPRFFKILVSDKNTNTDSDWHEIYNSTPAESSTNPTSLSEVKDPQYIQTNNLSYPQFKNIVKLDPQRPNYRYFDADKISELINKNVRYVKIVFTKTLNILLDNNNHNLSRGVQINEIVVNDNWDNVPKDPRFDGTNYLPANKNNYPVKFLDGNYNTYWSPDTQNGSLKFYVDPNTYDGKDLLVYSDGSATNATISVMLYDESTKKQETQKLGLLAFSNMTFDLTQSDSNKKIIGFQIDWSDKKPVIYELAPSRRPTTSSDDSHGKTTLAELKTQVDKTPENFDAWTKEAQDRWNKLKEQVSALVADNAKLPINTLNNIKESIDNAQKGDLKITADNVKTLNDIINATLPNTSYVQDANYALYQLLLTSAKQMIDPKNQNLYSQADYQALKDRFDQVQPTLKYTSFDQQVSDYNLAKIDSLDASHYDPQTFAKLQQAKKQLDSKIKSGTATPADYYQVNQLVKQSIDSLKPNDLGTTYTNLADAITKAKTFIAENALKFPQQSQQLQKQIDQWQATLNNKDAKLEDLQKALDRMNRANEDAQTQKDELVASLDNLLTPLANTDEIYTDASYQAYLDTINQIKTINHDPSMLTASDIQKYVKQIQDAQSMLAISPTKLETAKKQAVTLTEGLDSEVQQEFNDQLAKAKDTAALAKIINAINDKVQQSKKNKEVLSNSIKRLLDKLTNEKLKADLEQEVKEAKTENELANFKSKVLQLLSPKPTLPTQPDTPENGDKDTQKPEQGGSTNNPSNTEGSKPQEGDNSGSTTTPPTSENKPKDQNPQDNKNTQTSKTVEKSTGPTGGAIAGIVIAVLAFVLGIATFGYTWFKNKKKKSNQ